jgi:type IV secretion system protein VirD4
MSEDLYRLPTNARGNRQRFIALLILTVVVSLGLAASIAASLLAYHLHYPPALGSPLYAFNGSTVLRGLFLSVPALGLALAALRRQGSIVAPLALLFIASMLATAFPVYPPAAYTLARRALAASSYAPLVAEASRAGILALLALLASAAPFLIRLASAATGPADLHGSARFASSSDIERAGFILDDPAAILAQSSALPIGTILIRGAKRLVRLAGDVHVLLFAPPGAGKTTGLVIPTVQDFPENVIILDPKGEIATATAGHRRALGSRLLYLDPSRDLPHLARYNPLLSVRPYPFDVQDVVELAQLLVPDSPGTDPFWKQSARTLLEGVLLHVLYTSPVKTLGACYRALCDPVRPIDELFEAMLATHHDPSAEHGWTQHERVQTAARTFLDMPAQTRGGVVANAQAALSPYGDPILDRATAVSDFSVGDLFLRRERPVTLYLAIDPNSLARLSNHVRIVISQITSALTRQLPSEVNRRPVLMVLDEFPAFGRMPVLETALAYLRGYGVQVYIIVQHIGQLIANYGQSESVSPNCSVHIAFAPSHLETAVHLSKRVGQQTVRFERSSVALKTFGGAQKNVQDADAGRPLLAPDEIMRLPKGHALVLRTGTRPLVTEPVPYFRDPARQKAAQLPVPPSEPTQPDLSEWLDRQTPPAPVLGKRERRSRASLLTPEALR